MGEKPVKKQNSIEKAGSDKKVASAESVGDGQGDEEKGTEKKTTKTSRSGGKEEDLEEGEHKSKHAQSQFWSILSSMIFLDDFESRPVGAVGTRHLTEMKKVIVSESKT